MTSSDRQLMNGVRRGDENAFEELMERHQDAIRRHLIRTVRDADAAGDLTQEVFLRTWRRAEQWDGRGEVLAWLYRIATNLALNHLRSVDRRREQPLEPAADGKAAMAEWLADTRVETPEEAVIRGDRAARLRGIVDGLPEDKRQVWRLIHDGDMGVSGVAERLGIPEGTVKSRMHHARKLLAREWSAIVKEWENIK
jgi:RNA polymerase sigma-70 factor (ECF subfamily)